MEDFETLLSACRGAVERYIHCRVADRMACDDLLQETLLAAYRRFDRLRSPDSFKPWLLGIARHKCQDYYRERQALARVEVRAEPAASAGRGGRAVTESVRDTLDALSAADRELLWLFYYEELPQARIAEHFCIPVGTVKSRLSAARGRFRSLYPCPPKGERPMFKLPEIMPEYAIRPLSESPFPVRWEEMMGWFIVPRQGERLTWAMYDFPERRRTEIVEMAVIGRAEVHGIEGALISAREFDPSEQNRVGEDNPVEREFVAQLTDTHCRILSESHVEDGVRKLHTFLDGESFLPNWGFGEDNCGNEIRLTQKGDIVREGDIVTARDKPFLLDVVGRYEVRIGGRTFDTVCVMDLETYEEGVAYEQYLDRDGRTVLWRRFNRDDWALRRYGRPWTQLLPENERLTVNGKIYVHWYDCITDHIL